MSDNQLASCSESFGKLNKLRHLDLSKNYNITTLPETMTNLKNL